MEASGARPPGQGQQRTSRRLLNVPKANLYDCCQTYVSRMLNACRDACQNRRSIARSDPSRVESLCAFGWVMGIPPAIHRSFTGFENKHKSNRLVVTEHTALKLPTYRSLKLPTYRYRCLLKGSVLHSSWMHDGLPRSMHTPQKKIIYYRGPEVALGRAGAGWRRNTQLS